METNAVTAPVIDKCEFCEARIGLANSPHWTGSSDHAEAMTQTGRWVRINVCRDHRSAVVDFPRRPRKPRQPRPLYGDFAQLAQFHGIRTDGTGRRA